jgi:hypothetical protein
MSSIAPFSSQKTSMYDLLDSTGAIGSAQSSDSASLFSSYLDDEIETDSESQTATAGPLATAQDNSILQQISAGDPKLGTKFEQDMKSGNKKAILNDIQNALHEGLISKDAASQFMQQPDMEEMFKGTHMATKKGYEDVVNEDDSRGFDGGKGGSDLLRAGDNYDFKEVMKDIFAGIGIAAMAVIGAVASIIPGVGEAVDAGLGAAIGGIGAGLADGVAATGEVGAAVADTATSVASTAADTASSVASTVSDAVSPLTDTIDSAVDGTLSPVADLFGTDTDTLSSVADDASDAASLSERLNEEAQNSNQQQSTSQQQAYLQQLALEQAQFSVGA